MNVLLKDLPSLGWKSGLPAEFEMRLFSGAQTRLVGKAVDEKSMAPLFEALAQTMDIDFGALSIPDAYALLLHQRLASSHIKPIVHLWTCKKPMYEYSDGSYTELQDRPSLLVRPCDVQTSTIIDAHSLTIRTLSVEHETYDLPRMRNFEQATSSTFDWVAAHLSPNHRQAINQLESQEDLELWTSLSDWTAASKHGIQSGVSCDCSSCHRPSNSEWTFGPELFV